MAASPAAPSALHARMLLATKPWPSRRGACPSLGCLQGPLVGLAPRLAAYTKPGGVLGLSGEVPAPPRAGMPAGSRWAVPDRACVVHLFP